MEITMATATTEGRKRRRFSLEEKATIIREHLHSRVPISDLADKHGVQPSVIYGWLKQLMDNIPAALEGNGKAAINKDAALSREVEALKTRLAKKDAVIAEISAEYAELKKELGEL
jgi:transposase